MRRRCLTGRASTNDDRRDFDNLILLCRNDHTRIDNAEQTWTVTKLSELKPRHEQVYTGRHRQTAASGQRHHRCCIAFDGDGLVVVEDEDLGVTGSLVDAVGLLSEGVLGDLGHARVAGSPDAQAHDRGPSGSGTDFVEVTCRGCAIVGFRGGVRRAA